MAHNRIEMAEEALAQLDEQIAKLDTLRAAWNTILDAEREIASLPAVPEHQEVQSTVSPKRTPAGRRLKRSDYGDKADRMRAFVIGRQEVGVTQVEIMREARRLGSANIGYKFIARSTDRGEMKEQDGRFFPTPRMFESLRSNGVQPTQ